MSLPDEISNLKAQLDGAKERASKRYQDCRLQTRRADHAEKDLAEEKWKREDSEMKAMKLFNSYKATIAQLEKEKAEGQWAHAIGEQFQVYQAKAAQLQDERDTYRRTIAQLEAEKVQDKSVSDKSLQEARASEDRLRTELATQAQWRDVNMKRLQDKYSQEEQKTAALQRQAQQLSRELGWYKQQKQQQACNYAHQNSLSSNVGVHGGIPIPTGQSPVQTTDQGNKRRRLNSMGAFGTTTPDSRRGHSSSGSSNPISVTQNSLNVHDAVGTQAVGSQMYGFATQNAPTLEVLRVQDGIQGNKQTSEQMLPLSVYSSDHQHMQQVSYPSKSILGQISSRRPIGQQQILVDSAIHQQPRNTQYQQQKATQQQQQPPFHSAQQTSPNQHSAVSLVNGLNTLTPDQRSHLRQMAGSQKEKADIAKYFINCNKASESRDQQQGIYFPSVLGQNEGNILQLMDRTDSHQGTHSSPPLQQSTPQSSGGDSQYTNGAYGKQIVQPSVLAQQAIPGKPTNIVQQTSQNIDSQGYQYGQQINTPKANSHLSSSPTASVEQPQQNPRVYQQQSSPIHPQIQILPLSADQFTNIQTSSTFPTLSMNETQGSAQNDIAPGWASSTLGMVDPILVSDQSQSTNFDTLNSSDWFSTILPDDLPLGDMQQTNSFKELQTIVPTLDVQQSQQDCQLHTIDPGLIHLDNDHSLQQHTASNRYPNQNTASTPQLSIYGTQTYPSVPVHAKIQKSQHPASPARPAQKRLPTPSIRKMPTSRRSTPTPRPNSVRPAPTPTIHRASIACTHCHSNWWNESCDDGEPCQNCILSGSTPCERPRCKDYNAGTCTKKTCRFVHEKDGRYRRIAGFASKLRRNGTSAQAKPSPVQLAYGNGSVLGKRKA